MSAMDNSSWVFDRKVWSRINQFLGLGGSSSCPQEVSQETFSLEQISDHVYEIHAKPRIPSAKRPRMPSVKILFFHGLQLHDSNQPYITSWLSRDGKELWLSWLLEESQDARVFTISYDAFPERRKDRALDMYCTCENLVVELVKGKTSLGERGCPVVLVGHCLGGLVLKELCVKIAHRTGIERPDECTKYYNFLDNVKGIFCYSSPHHGSELPDCTTKYPLARGSLFEDVKPLHKHTARRNEEFRKLRETRGWKSRGVGESRPVTLGGFTGLIVREGSSRHDVDDFYTATADHFDVCRPESKTSSTYRLLTQFIDEIMGKSTNVSKRNPDGQSMLGFTYFGLEGKVIEVLELLGVRGETMEPGSWAILLHGMGGIGKTTLARAVFAKIPIIDDFVAEVEVGENATPKVILKIQRDICKRLFQDEEEIGSCGEGRERLRRRLSQCRHAVLLFIDNVFKQEDLRTLLPVPLDLPDGSRLIITARDKRICEVFNACKSYLVRELEKPDGKKLFDRLVEGCPPGTEEQVATILEICGGLPLALEVVGRYLGPPGNRKMKLREWESVIYGLRNCQNINGEAREKLNDILAWSYKQLGEGTKQAFLDVSYLLRNADWDWGECLGTGSELERLKDLSLVKRLDRDMGFSIFEMFSVMRQYQRIWKLEGVEKFRLDFFLQHRSTIEVHDLLVGLGTHISKSSPRTRFSFNSPETFGDLLTDDRQDYGIIEGLVVELVDCKHDLPAAKLDAMRASLRILVLRGGVHIQGTCDRLPHQLQVCCLHLYAGGIAFPYTDLSGLNKLRVLDIHGGVACDFQDMQFPRSLEILKLQNVPELHAFHSSSFEKCIFLRTLHITGCSKFQQLPTSFCGLEKLSTLVLHQNPGLKVLPDFDCLQSLQILFIRYSAAEVPHGIDKLVKLHKLCIQGVECLPNDLDVFGLTLLETLVLDFARSNKELPKGFQNALCLETNICDSAALEELPRDFGGLTNLQNLQLVNCGQLEMLLNGVGSCKSLRQLVLHDCARLQNLPNTFGNLIALESLKLGHCVQLKELPHDFGNLIALKKLDLFNAKRLKVLPDRLFSLKNLRSLRLEGCTNLESLPWPASLASLQNFIYLSLAGCTKLKELPTDFSDLVALQHLCLDDCESLESLPENMASLENLTLVRLNRCTRLKKLPKDFDSLQARVTVLIDGTPIQYLRCHSGGAHL